MTHTYQVTGMTCGSCEATVKSKLLMLPEVSSVEVSKENQTATISMEKHISLPRLQESLGGSSAQFKISALQHSEKTEELKSWLVSYKPVILVFLYLTGGTLLIQAGSGQFHFMEWMRHFMGSFFLVFSFFKFLNLEGFVNNYSTYDVVAKRFRGWAYLYPFIELSLGIAFVTDFEPLLTNLITIIVMGISIIGVLQSVLNKRKIQCACLGDVFNLPMSTITILEDGVMIGMSIMMLASF